MENSPVNEKQSASLLKRCLRTAGATMAIAGLVTYFGIDITEKAACSEKESGACAGDNEVAKNTVLVLSGVGTLVLTASTRKNDQ